MAPLKCAAGGEDKWEEITAAGSNFSSIMPWPGQGCFGPRAKWYFKIICRKKYHSDHAFPAEKL